MFGIRRVDRARSLALVFGAHAIGLWLILAFAHTSFIRDRETIVDVFDVRPVEPPPPRAPPPRPDRKREGAAAPARAAAPLVRIETVPPLVRTIVVDPAPTAATASGAQSPASGIGGGGTGGMGSGLGLIGTGAGGTRPAMAARLRGGRIEPRDYPRAARGAQGSVTAHVAVGSDGRVTGCSVARSSGNAVLDAATCRLIRERFSFTPARNALGEAVPGEFGWQQRWWRD